MNEKIVNLRALAILVVVLGHSIILYDPSWNVIHTDVEMPMFAYLKKCINIIQMPLFFSISGFLLYYKYEKGLGRFSTFISKKVKRLIIPYIAIAILWMDPIKIALGVQKYDFSFSLLAKQLLAENCGHLWFLPCLFLIFVGLYIALWGIQRFGSGKHDNDKSLTALFVILIFLNLVGSKFPNIFQLSNVASYAIYFYFGFLINQILRCVNSWGGTVNYSNNAIGDVSYL